MLSVIVDILLAFLLIGYLVQGYRSGFLRNVFSIAGVLGGAIAAVLLTPSVTGLIAQAPIRLVATIALFLALIVIGSIVGGALGKALARTVPRGPLRTLDKIAGAVSGVIVTALAASMVAFGIGSLGVPVLSPAISSSVVLAGIDRLTPDPVKSTMAQLRALVVSDGIPSISEALGGPTTAPSVPSLDTGTDAVSTASRSVVRISGNAYACGQSQTGSGFVVAPDRVVTNAHVVSGVSEPVVESRSDGTVSGRVVYFDPVDDIAVIATDGLAAPALGFGTSLAAGTDAVALGYPFGGPFAAKPANVISVATLVVNDIYASSSSPREVYTLAADVQPGNSGGPLLSVDGAIVGIVFAKGADTPNVGYAATMTELAPVLAQAPTLNAGVSSGSCTTE
ncbi:MarP family serine protease [Amnibacterium flavum]|uniref:Serine protease n=1 Tax=Amnibacterium flavum TaxID=2173173 RepID=A0A2V1HRJ5_9MICO|nr:MarP family serine protease [Amnibacterium flavum]PVZ93590.1 serine protease [Amnibacterium flavum]